MNQITEDQHFVPKFYLKKFANDKGFVEVFDYARRMIGKPRPYASVCYDKFFYGLITGVSDDISQEFEKMFSGFEDHLSKNWDSIIENAKNKSLTESDFDDLSWFMSLQWMRTPSFRARMNAMTSDLDSKIMKMRVGMREFKEDYKKIAKKHGIEITDEDLVEMKRKILDDEFTIERNNSGHLRFIPGALEGFSNLMYAKQWNVMLSPPNQSFITTDNPVAEWIPRRTGFYGATFLERKHYLTLSPRILIELVHPTRDSLKVGPHETVTYKTIPKDKVIMHNMLLLDHGFSHAYSAKKNEFNELLSQLKKPGKAASLYLENYFNK